LLINKESFDFLCKSFTYQLILVHEADYLYKIYYNRFVKYKEVRKLGVLIIIKDKVEKEIAYFPREFTFIKGFYRYSYITILSSENDLLEFCKEEYFFRP